MDLRFQPTARRRRPLRSCAGAAVLAVVGVWAACGRTALGPLGARRRVTAAAAGAVGPGPAASRSARRRRGGLPRTHRPASGLHRGAAHAPRRPAAPRRRPAGCWPGGASGRAASSLAIRHIDFISARVWGDSRADAVTLAATVRLTVRRGSPLPSGLDDAVLHPGEGPERGGLAGHSRHHEPVNRPERGSPCSTSRTRERRCSRCSSSRSPSRLAPASGTAADRRRRRRRRRAAPRRGPLSRAGGRRRRPRSPTSRPAPEAVLGTGRRPRALAARCAAGLAAGAPRGDCSPSAHGAWPTTSVTPRPPSSCRVSDRQGARLARRPARPPSPPTSSASTPGPTARAAADTEGEGLDHVVTLVRRRRPLARRRRRATRPTSRRACSRPPARRQPPSQRRRAASRRAPAACPAGRGGHAARRHAAARPAAGQRPPARGPATWPSSATTAPPPRPTPTSYALSYNPTYTSFSADCANFGSQVMFAGGYPQFGDTYARAGGTTSTARARRATTRTATPGSPWPTSRAPGTSGTPTSSRPSPTVGAGDFVYYDWTGDGTWDHVAELVGTNSAGQKVVDAHTTDHYHVFWKLGTSATHYRFARTRATIVI